jgi:hypothetical protein
MFAILWQYKEVVLCYSYWFFCNVNVSCLFTLVLYIAVSFFVSYKLNYRYRCPHCTKRTFVVWKQRQLLTSGGMSSVQWF